MPIKTKARTEDLFLVSGDCEAVGLGDTDEKPKTVPDPLDNCSNGLSDGMDVGFGVFAGVGVGVFVGDGVEVLVGVEVGVGVGVEVGPGVCVYSSNETSSKYVIAIVPDDLELIAKRILAEFALLGA